MQTIIEKTCDLDRKVLKEIWEKIPDKWNWLKSELLIKNPVDLWVKLVHENISCIIKIENKLITYWSISNNWLLFDNIIASLWLNKYEIFLWTYLFTIDWYKNKWYAKSLKQQQIEYIKKNFPNVTKIIGSTNEIKLLELYIKNWAKKIELQDKNNPILIQEWINNDFYYYYQI